jgi:DNA-binding transcriptional MerR regulator
METKAKCIQANYPGTRLYEVGDEADLSEIDYKSRHCWEIGGVNLKEIEELDDQRFYLVKGMSEEAKKIGKKMKEEIKVIENRAKSLEDENAELKLKLAKLEGAAGKKAIPKKELPAETEDAPEEGADKEDIF